MQEITLEKIYEEIQSLKQSISKLNSRMDKDTLMTREEEAIYDKSIKELESGETTKLEDFKKELFPKNARN